MAQENIVQFGPWITHGWELYRSRWKLWVMISALLFLPILIVMLLAVIAAFRLANHVSFEMTTIWMILGATMGMMAFVLLWTGYMTAIAYRTAFRQLSGEIVESVDFGSAGGGDSIRIAGAFLITLFLTMLGALFCILPAYIVGGLLYLAIPEMVRNQTGVFEAIRRSVNVTRKDWLRFTVFAFVVGLIAQIGVYACYIGVIFTLPLMYTISATAYLECFEKKVLAESPASSAGKSRYCLRCGQPVHPTNRFCRYCGAPQN